MSQRIESGLKSLKFGCLYSFQCFSMTLAVLWDRSMLFKAMLGCMPNLSERKWPKACTLLEILIEFCTKIFMVLSIFLQQLDNLVFIIQIHSLSVDSQKVSRISPGKKKIILSDYFFLGKQKITGVSNSWPRNANTRESAILGKSKRIFNVLLSLTYCKTYLIKLCLGLTFIRHTLHSK